MYLSVFKSLIRLVFCLNSVARFSLFDNEQQWRSPPLALSANAIYTVYRNSDWNGVAIFRVTNLGTNQLYFTTNLIVSIWRIQHYIYCIVGRPSANQLKQLERFWTVPDSSVKRSEYYTGNAWLPQEGQSWCISRKQFIVTLSFHLLFEKSG